MIDAWAAGFFDGEGSVGLYRESNPQPRLQISQLDPAPLQKFLSTYGGWLSSFEQNGKTVHRWTLQNHSLILACLKAMLPYLTVKREQAELLIMWLNLPWRGKGGAGRSETQAEIDNTWIVTIKAAKRDYAQAA